MKVLLIGSGGREHALAWKLADSPQVTGLFAWPGNPGIAQLAECAGSSVMDFKGIEKFAKENGIGLVVVGPEDPLAGGLVDRLTAAGIKTFGPTQEAARLEADKWFAKEVMRQQAVPTAEARSFTDASAAEEYVKNRNGEVVIKAAGLAKGKGVTLCYRVPDALEAIDQIMRKRAFGDAGERVVIEEMLKGPECSVLAFVSDRSIYVMQPAQDHKPVEDGDAGPMTGGMGAYSPTPVIDDAIMHTVERQILVPVVDALIRDNIRYKGVLYAGLMMTTTGPKVLEFNCRFGDPETQALMMRLKSDLFDVMLATVDGKLDRAKLVWDDRPAITVVATSKGYPGDYPKGLEIAGIDDADAMQETKVFHSGTKMEGGKLVTDGGRVLSVTALGDTIAQAQKRAYEAMAKIHFDGIYYRRDIAHQAIRLAKMKAGGTIRVMTFNLRVGTAPDGDNAWDRRRELLTGTIRAADPDLLGTQECLSLQRKFLQDGFPDYELSGVGRDDGQELGESASLLCKRDRFEYLDAGTFWLSKDPSAVGSRSWDAKLPRICSWARLRMLDDGRELFFLNTHFDHIGIIARSESAHLLRKWIAAHTHGLPIVLTGDFNADGGSEPYEILRHGGLMDAWRAAHPTPIAEEGTYHAFTGSRMRERIDWIFCSAHFDVLSCKVDYTSRNGRFPSDHFPVTAELRLARP